MNFTDDAIDTILWDVDGTLLDFLAAERAVIKTLFTELGLGVCTDAMVDRYSAINLSYWERLERGEITKDEVLLGRFEQFFTEMGLDTSIAPSFNQTYQIRLGDVIVYCDDSRSIVTSLKGKVRQYAVSNGTIIAQTRKLKESGFDRLLDQVFLSEKLGAEKPDPVFFEKVFAAIGPVKKANILIVGDSLTSDMLGGARAGIRTCWYNPKHMKNDKPVQPDWEISDLHEIYHILDGTNRSR